MTEAEENRHKTGIPRGKIAEVRIWNKRPDGLAIKMPTTEKLGEFVILEFKRMSDVTDHTGKTCSGSSIHVYYNVGARTNAWSPRMVGDPEELYSGSKISVRTGST
jgi:hypothetical protein